MTGTHRAAADVTAANRVYAPAPQPAPQSSQQTTEVSPGSLGVSAYAVKGDSVLVCKGDQWVPAKPGELNGDQPSIPKYIYGDDNAWHYPNDPHAGDAPEFGGRYIELEGKPVSVQPGSNLFLNGHYLLVNGQPLFITQVNHQKVVGTKELREAVARVPAGSKVEFTVQIPDKDVRDRAEAVIVRTVGQPRGVAQSARSVCEDVVRSSAMLAVSGDTPAAPAANARDLGARIAKIVETHRDIAIGGIKAETTAFYNTRDGGHKAAANAAAVVLRRVVNDENDMNELLSPMLKEAGDHPGRPAPVESSHQHSELVDRAMKTLPANKQYLRPLVAEFIWEAARRAAAGAKDNQAFSAKDIQYGT